MVPVRVRFDRPGGSWGAVRALLETLGPKAEVYVPTGVLGHPRLEGAAASVGLPRGQRSDWRFEPNADCTGLHVHEFADGWAAHLDQVHPACGLVPHLQADAPGVLLVAGSLLGASIGAAVGRPILGALFGLVLGAATASGGGQLQVVRRLQATVRRTDADEG